MAKKHTVPHIHEDNRVNTDRVDAFALAPRQEQMTTLAELRSRVKDDSNSVELAVSLALVGALITVVVPLPESISALQNPNWWVAAIVWVLLCLAIGAGLFIALLPVLISTMRHSRKRDLAELWLRAYEDELDGRWSRQDRPARRWQKERSATVARLHTE